MNQALPCPYCGYIGFHMWAGSGGCPGATSERDRDGHVAALLGAQKVQAEVQSMQIVGLKALCVQAADALAFYYEQVGVHPIGVAELYAELRKAAE